ncbi:MAG: energy transducer TonB [Nannocystales bacterium]
MFDVYMEGQSVDPRTRVRMMMALVASLSVTTVAGSMGWASGRLSIGTVGPPSFPTSELSLHTMAPMVRTDPPPRPKAPNTEVTPSAVAARTSPNPRRGEPKAESSDGAPTEQVSKSQVGAADGAEDGVSSIPGPRSPGCVGVGCVPNAPIGDPPWTVDREKKQGKPDKAREALSVLKARGIYTPDPQAAALAKTKTGLGSRAPGTVKVEFCVGPSGKVSSAKVARRFSGDREVDRICRAAVEKWRFKPARVGGKARTTCSDVTFRIEFDG